MVRKTTKKGTKGLAERDAAGRMVPLRSRKSSWTGTETLPQFGGSSCFPGNTDAARDDDVARRGRGHSSSFTSSET